MFKIGDIVKVVSYPSNPNNPNMVPKVDEVGVIDSYWENKKYKSYLEFPYNVKFERLDKVFLMAERELELANV